MQTLRGIFNYLERTVLLKDDVTLWDLALSIVKGVAGDFVR